jgi:hypothetical protein
MSDKPLMSVAEIDLLYPGEWCVLGDVEYGPAGELARGRVVFHDADREVAKKVARALKPQEGVIVCAGEMVRDLDLML